MFEKFHEPAGKHTLQANTGRTRKIELVYMLEQNKHN